MRFAVEQRFPAPLEAVEAALLDPAFLARLALLPKLGEPQLLGSEVDGPIVRQQVRYRFAGELAPAVTAVVDPQRLTWVEHTTFDRGSHRGEHRIVPDHYGDRLRCSYTTQLDHTTQPGGDGPLTSRVTEGDLRVRFPLVGGRVERAIVSGLLEHAELEAEVLGRWLAQDTDQG